MKRILGLLISAIMILSGITAVSAAESTTTYSITIKNTTAGHTYEAYQIFKGRDAQDKILTDIQWGENVDSQALLTELDSQPEFAKCTTAAEVADALSKNADSVKKFAKIAANYLTGTAKGSANTPGDSGYVISNLPAGYYLVKDKDNTLPDVHDAYTDFILEVVGNVTVAPKSSVPTVTKKVQENSNGTWQDGADYNIGDDVPFQLTGTLPKTLSSYTTYKYTFHDKMSEGLTFNQDSVKVSVLNGNQTTNVPTEQYTVNTTGQTDGCTFELQFDNLLTVANVSANSQIIVEYTAKLNNNAVIAGVGNPNEVHLTFSNNPNGEGTGKTPKDKVTVFTFELVVNKKDENGTNPLKGAAFELMKKVTGQTEEWKSVTKYEAGEMTKFEFKGLDSGEYKLVEVTAPAGYNKIEDILFKVEATYEKDSVDPQLKSIVIKDSKGGVISGADQSFKVNVNPGKGEGNIVTDVINKKGTTLPETGGMGTTIFYVVGCILVLGAAIALFFIKKRA